MFVFEPRDIIEVEAPHGLGIVLYIAVNGSHQNDIFCVANKDTGQLFHYETVQLKLARNATLGIKPSGTSELDQKERNHTIPPMRPPPELHPSSAPRIP